MAPPRIRQVTIGSGSWVAITVAVACDNARLHIPASATASVDIREDDTDATKQDTVEAGQYYTAAAERRPGGNVRFASGDRICYARAQSGTVTGVVHCLDE